MFFWGMGLGLPLLEALFFSALSFNVRHNEARAVSDD